MPTLGRWEVIILLIVQVMVGLGVMAVAGAVRLIGGRVVTGLPSRTVPPAGAGDLRAEVQTLVADLPEADVAQVAVLARQLRAKRSRWPLPR